MDNPITVNDQTTIKQGKGMDSPIKTYINVHVKLTDRDGNVRHEEHGANLVTTVGKNYIADALSAAPGSAAMSHMAIGTGAVAAAVGDTVLGAEIVRVALTSRTDTGAVVTYVGDYPAGTGTNTAIREAGIFNAATVGTLLARFVFATAIDKQAGDTLQITWTLTIG